MYNGVIALLLATRVLLGDPFPATSLPALDGPAIALPPRGQVLVVEIFATWCASCHEALPIVEGLRSRFGSDLVVVTVSEDEGEDARAKLTRMAAETGLSGPILLDSRHDLYQRLGVRKLPTAYVVDAEGVVRHIDNGFGPGYKARLVRWVMEALRAHSHAAP
jgi:thiol-disulfide isomerase/thioredoxin